MPNESTGVFISHHSNSTVNLVLELSGVLQAFSIPHWYAERDIQPMDNYTEVIPLVIEKCELMLLLLNKESNVSRQVAARGAVRPALEDTRDDRAAG